MATLQLTYSVMRSFMENHAEVPVRFGPNHALVLDLYLKLVPVSFSFVCCSGGCAATAAPSPSVVVWLMMFQICTTEGPFSWLCRSHPRLAARVDFTAEQADAPAQDFRPHGRV
jgi:hypothetical protein